MIARVILTLTAVFVVAVVFGCMLLAVPKNDDFSRAVPTSYITGDRVSNSQYVIDAYIGWTGRWSAMALAVSLFSRVDLFQAYGPILVVLGCFLLLAAFLACQMLYDKTISPAVKLALAVIFVALVWSGIPRIWQSSFWISGFIENMLPLAMAAVSVYLSEQWIASTKPSVKIALGFLAGLCIFLGTGLHELFAVLMTVLFAGLLIVSRTRSRRRYYATLLLVATIGCGISICAPGNFSRVGAESQHEWMALPISTRIPLGTKSSLVVLGGAVIQWIASIRLLSSSALFLLLFNGQGRAEWKGALVTTSVTAGLLFLWYAMPFIAIGTVPGRTEGAAHTIFLVSWFITLSLILGAPGTLRWRPRPCTTAIGVLALLLSYSLLNSENTRRLAADLHTGRAIAYREEMLRRDRRAKAAVRDGVEHFVVTPPASRPFSRYRSDVTNDPDHWINQSVARYWGLSKVRLVEESHSPGL